MKHLCQELTLLALFLLSVLTVKAYDFELNGFYYNITSSTAKTVAVTGETTSDTSYSVTLTIPAKVTYNNVTYSVTSIGDWFFGDCKGLTDITCFAETPPTCGNESMGGINTGKCKLYVPAKSVAAYQTDATWGGIRKYCGIIIG